MSWQQFLPITRLHGPEGDFSMYSEFSGEVWGGKRPGSPVSLKGEVLAHTEKGIRVRVGRQVLQVPLSQSQPPPVGARVLLQISPSGEMRVIPAKGESLSAPLSRDLLPALSGNAAKASAYGGASANPILWGVVRGMEPLPANRSVSADAPGRSLLLTLDVGDSQIKGEFSGKAGVGDVLSIQLLPSEKPGMYLIAHVKPESLGGTSPLKGEWAGAVSQGLPGFAPFADGSHPASILAYEALLPFKAEPYFAQSVSDFAAFLKSSPAFSGSQLVVPPGWEGTAQQWVQHLLGMYAANSGSSPEALNAWIHLQNRPGELEKILTQWKPAANASQTLLLHGDLPLVHRDASGVRESITLREIWQHPQRLDSLSASSDDKHLLKQLAQAFQMEQSMGGGARDSGGGGENFGLSYAWQEGRWRKIKVQWRASGGKKKKKEEQNFRISTEGKHLGRVEVDLNLKPAGAGLNIQTQHHDIREHLPEAIRSLEKKLNHLDFKVMSWYWEPLREKKGGKPGRGSPFADNAFRGDASAGMGSRGDSSSGDVDLIV